MKVKEREIVIYEEVLNIKSFRDICREIEVSNLNNEINQLKQQLQEAVSKMNILESYAFPIHIIFFITLTAVALGVFGLMYALQLFKGIYLIHPFYLVTGFIGALGLLIVGLISTKNWKVWLIRYDK